MTLLFVAAARVDTLGQAGELRASIVAAARFNANWFPVVGRSDSSEAATAAMATFKPLRFEAASTSSARAPPQALG